MVLRSREKAEEEDESECRRTTWWRGPCGTTVPNAGEGDHPDEVLGFPTREPGESRSARCSVKSRPVSATLTPVEEEEGALQGRGTGPKG